MIEPTRSDLGKKVIYKPVGQEPETGVVTSYNQNYVFVRFGDDQTSKACSRGSLEWVK